MSLNEKPFNSIGAQDLQDLVTNQVREGKLIEYKEALPGNSDRDKKEFLADVSSFSNTLEGHLIFGIKESSGIATELCGLETINVDATISRMENLLRDGLQPRLAGYQIRPVPLSNSGVAIVLRIPRSWMLPHRVVFGGHDKFYGRNSSGKYQLDVPELRTLFTLSESTAKRIRDWRAERLHLIAGNETPVPMSKEGPIKAYNGSSSLSFLRIYTRHGRQCLRYGYRCLTA